MPNPVSISFCCNEPNSGIFRGRFCNVEIGDNLLSLDNKFCPPKEPKLDYRFTITDSGTGFAANRAEGIIKVSHRQFPIIGYKYGWGNWVWDLVIVTPKVALDLANYFQALGHWTSEGDAEFCDYFDAGKPFDRDSKHWIDLLRERG